MNIFTQDGWPNFSEEDGLLSMHANMIMIWGAR